MFGAIQFVSKCFVLAFSKEAERLKPTELQSFLHICILEEILYESYAIKGHSPFSLLISYDQVYYHDRCQNL